MWLAYIDKLVEWCCDLDYEHVIIIPSLFLCDIDPDKLIAQFTNGSDARCNDDTIETEIVFVCNPIANWDSLLDNDASKFFESIIVDYKDLCKVKL